MPGPRGSPWTRCLPGKYLAPACKKSRQPDRAPRTRARNHGGRPCMNTALIGELVKLRYQLLWAKTRSRNGRIALFLAGYLLLVLVIALLAGYLLLVLV